MSSEKFTIGEADCEDAGEQPSYNPGQVEVFVAGLAVLNSGIQCPDGTYARAGIINHTVDATIALLNSQPSSQEYIADVLDNIGIPQVSSAYAQGTGYSAMSPFLPFWKAFRNVAYSLYIIMFVVVGIMIMLRTKINAQTVITIQSALPNLVITLLLITFSYAIVGFMIDIMYFLIYFVVYLASAFDIITSPTTVIDRLLSHSARGVIFDGRNSIIRGVSLALTSIMNGVGGGLEVLGRVISAFTIMNLVVSIAFTIASLKLLFALIKSYIMIIIQLITAPIQLLFNALPGSEAFSKWLKKTASYIIPFPVAAAMFIIAAIFIGDPTNSTYLGGAGIPITDANPFTINSSLDLHNEQNLWIPPFTLQGGVDITNNDILSLIGFVIFLMTPASVKMAQEWLQVKESPYTAEALSSAGIGVKAGTLPATWGWKSIQEEAASRRSAEHLAGAIRQTGSPTERRPAD